MYMPDVTIQNQIRCRRYGTALYLHHSIYYAVITYASTANLYVIGC